MTSYHVLPNFQQKDALDADIGPKEWVAYNGDDQKLRGKGHWKQRFVFKSSIILSSPFATPTFKHLLIDVNYALRLECIIPSHRSLFPNQSIIIKHPIIISYGLSPSSSAPASSRILTDSDVGRVYSV